MLAIDECGIRQIDGLWYPWLWNEDHAEVWWPLDAATCEVSGCHTAVSNGRTDKAVEYVSTGYRSKAYARRKLRETIREILGIEDWMDEEDEEYVRAEALIKSIQVED